MWKYDPRRSSYLMHFGVGHKNGGHSGRYPYGSGKKNSTNGTKGGKVNTGSFNRSPSSRPTVRLAKSEYERVISSIQTNITRDQRLNDPTIAHYYGNYIYIAENNFDGTFRIIAKRKSKNIHR